MTSVRIKAYLVGLSSVYMLGVLSSSVLAQTNNSYPMLMSLKPTAAQIGATTEHELHARYNLAGADQVFVSGEGVIAKIIPLDTEKPEDRKRNDITDSKCKIQISVAADATPGVRDFRVMTPHGASTIGQLVVGRDPVISEATDNDSAEKAQGISIPATICGTIEKGEDVDYFRFKASAGQKLSFHVQSQRLMNRLHDMQTRIDPLIAIKTLSGAVIASSDNVYAGDPLLFHEFQSNGDYLLEVRDVRYQGNIDWVYSIEIHDRPYVTHTYPMVISSHSPTAVELFGWNLPSDKTVTIAPSTHLTESKERPWIGDNSGSRVISTQIGGFPTNAFSVFQTSLPISVESSASSESSQLSSANSLDRTLQSISTPAMIVGKLDQIGEIDRFEFDAKAQDKYYIASYSRRIASGMDPKLRIVNSQGATVIEADDSTLQRMTIADPIVDSWTCPTDGKYTLEVMDLHGRGGDAFTYALQFSKAEPFYELEVDTDKTLLAPGMTSVVYFRANRKNGFAGDIDLIAEQLPTGVTATSGRILSNGSDGCILLSADSTVQSGMTNIVFRGNAISKEGEPPSVSNGKTPFPVVQATVLQEYYLPGGGRGNYPVLTHALSIAEPMDIRKIEVSENEIVLKPGESKKINVTVQRADDYKGNVTLDVIYQHLEQPYGNSLPKGVKLDVANSKTLLSAGENSGFITLKADADAPSVESQLVPINVHVSINFVMKHTLCGTPLKISVRP